MNDRRDDAPPPEQDFAARWGAAGAKAGEARVIAADISAAAAVTESRPGMTWSVVQGRARARRRERRIQKLSFGLAFGLLGAAIIFSAVTNFRAQPAPAVTVAETDPPDLLPAAPENSAEWIDPALTAAPRPLAGGEVAVDSKLASTEATSPVTIDTAAKTIASKATPPRRSIEGELELYRKGLSLLRGGSPSRAAQIFSDYLAQYPRGTLREEAELSRLEALHTANDDAGFRRAATSWLASHPDHPRAAEVRALINHKK